MDFEEKPKTYFEDIKEGLNNMHIDPNYPFMIVYIPHHPNISRESTINFFRQLENTELVIVCKEVQKEEYRISFRSKQYINVAKIAHAFDGGGHVRASGDACQATFSALNETHSTMLRGISMNGFLLVNKPEGITSYDVIRKLKTFLPKKTKIWTFRYSGPICNRSLNRCHRADYARQLNTL